MKRALQIFRDGEVHESYLIEPLLPGEQGNMQTLEAMKEIVLADRLSPDIRIWVLREVIGFIPPQGSLDGLRRIYEYARDRIKYVPDPMEVEIVADIWSTLNALALQFRPGDPLTPIGDCGTKTTFIASCAAMIGFKSQFAIVKQRDRNATSFDHVYPVIGIDGQWVPYDATPPNAVPGWQVSAVETLWFPIFD